MSIAHFPHVACPPPQRILLYGVPGVGCSTFAAALPQAVVIPTDRSSQTVPGRRFPVVSRYADLLRAIGVLYDAPPLFRAVVIDTLDGLQYLIESEADRLAAKHSGASWRRHYVGVWRELFEALDMLARRHAMTCVLVGRASPEPRCTALGLVYPPLQRYAPLLDPPAVSLVMSWATNVLFASPTARSGPCESSHTADKGDRVLHTTPSIAHVAYNRLGLPRVLPLCAKHFAECLSPPRYRIVHPN